MDERQPYNPFRAAADPPAPVAPPAARSRLPAIAIAAGVIAAIAIIGAIVAVTGGSGGAGSRDDVVAAAIAALSDGDIDALMELGDVERAIADGLDCASHGGKSYGTSAAELDAEVRELKRTFQKRVDALAGARLELLRVLDDPDRAAKRIAKGERLRIGCVARDDLGEYRVLAKVKITEPDAKKSYEQTVKLEIIQVGSRYYLAKLFEIELLGPTNDLVDKFHGLANEMCACQDLSCAERVQEELVKLGMDSRRQTDRTVIREIADATSRAGDCHRRLQRRRY